MFVQHIMSSPILEKEHKPYIPLFAILSWNLILSILVGFCWCCLVVDWTAVLLPSFPLWDNLRSEWWVMMPSSQKRKGVPTTSKIFEAFCSPGRLHDKNSFVAFWLAAIVSFVRQSKELYRYLFGTPVRRAIWRYLTVSILAFEQMSQHKKQTITAFSSLVTMTRSFGHANFCLPSDCYRIKVQ